MQPHAVVMVSSQRPGSVVKTCHQCLTDTAVARDTTVKEPEKRTNGVLLLELACGGVFSSKNQEYGV